MHAVRARRKRTWRHGRVVREYLGRGLAADLAAERDALARAERAALAAQLGDLAGMARRQLATAAYGPDNLLGAALVERQVEHLRRELEGQSATSLERMLVERIVTCWAAAYLADIAAAAHASSPLK